MEIVTVTATIGGCTHTDDIVIGVTFWTTPFAIFLAMACLTGAFFTSGPLGYSNYEFLINNVQEQDGLIIS